MKLQTHGLHILRAGNQHLFSVQGEEVRTLPHFAVLIAAAVQGADEFPFEAVLAVIEQDGPAAVGGTVAYDGAEGPIGFPPDLGVPEVNGAASLGQISGVQDGVGQNLLVIQPVSNGHALSLDVLKKAIRITAPLNAGVHKKLPAVGKLRRAAGEAAGRIIILVRG